MDFSELYRTHAADVHRFVLFPSGDPALADDILSETFIRLWHARARVDLTTVKGYLLTIARDLFLADRRRVRRMTALDEWTRDPHSRLPGGEASADTQALVESWLKSDAGLAADVEAARDGGLGLPATSAPTAEKETLDATRQLLKARTSTLAVAMVFTMLPFTFVVRGNTLTFLLIRDAPIIGIAWWVTAAIMWIWHASIRRRLRVPGL